MIQRRTLRILGIVALVFVVACAAAILGIIIYSATHYGNFEAFPDCFLLVVAGLGGAVVGYLIHNALHELGHVIGAKAVGCKVFEVAFAGFVFGKGKKISFMRESGIAGWVAFVPYAPENALKALISSLRWSKLFSVLAGLIGVGLSAAATAAKNYYAESFCLIFVFAVFYLIMINLMPTGDGENDGDIAYDDDGNLVASLLFTKAAELEYQSCLYLGKTAKDIPALECSHYSGKDWHTIFDVQKCLQLGNITGAKDALKCVFDEQKTLNNRPIALYLEELFINIVTNNADALKNIRPEVKRLIDSPDDPFTYRVAIYYRRYNGESDWAEALIGTFKKICKDYVLPGMAATQLEIFDRYL